MVKLVKLGQLGYCAPLNIPTPLTSDYTVHSKGIKIGPSGPNVLF